MLTSRFGSSIGTKLSEQGTFRCFAGNTIVSSLVDSPIFPALVHLQQRLLADGRAPYLAPLPPPSFHMTLFEGLCDQNREEGRWSSHVPLDATIEEATALLKDRWTQLPSLEAAVMRLDSLGINTAVSVGLLPSTQDDWERLQEYRRCASQLLGIALPSRDTYRFHVGLAYGMMPAEGDDALFTRFRCEIDTELRSKNMQFVLPTPKFCSFVDMTEFLPV